MTELVFPGVELVLIHVPRTAGTWTRDVFLTYWDGKAVLGRSTRGKRLLERLEREPDASLVCGHIWMKTVIDLFPNAKTAAFLRDPLERAVSHYNYLVWKKASRDRRYPTFRKWVKHGMNKNLISRMLEGKKLDFITTDPDLHRRTAECLSFFGVAQVTAKELRQRFPKRSGVVTNTDTSVITEEDRNLFYRLNRKDMELYNAVHARWQKGL